MTASRFSALVEFKLTLKLADVIFQGSVGANFDPKLGPNPFEDGFKFGDLENPHNRCFLQIERIRFINKKKCPFTTW